MWQDHYQSLLNSVKNLEHKTSVTSKLSFIENESIEIRPLDIVAIALSTIAITHLYIISIQIAIMSIVKPCLHITMK